MIHFENVDFGYKKGRPLYSNLQLNVETGFIYGLLGKNGAGKSTLLKLITGLVFPGSGKISVMQHDPSKRTPGFLQNIFFIPEEIDTPEVDVLAFADSFVPFYPHFNKDQFANLLHEFEVPLRNLRQMSYGQKKKTWIALGIAANTPLLVLDQPTNGLDIPSKKQFRKMMASTVNDARCVIISTHQVRDLENLIDKILIVDEGELVVNAGIGTIMQKLCFKQFSNERDAWDSLYAENSLMGTLAVIPNKSGDCDSRMDIELFFNATIANKKQIQSLFMQ